MQKAIPENEALLPTGEVVDTPRVGKRPIGLPIDLVMRSVSRLRVLALLYAFVFFMVAVFPVFVVRQDRSAASWFYFFRYGDPIMTALR